MKKIFSVVMVALLAVLCLTGCSAKSPTDKQATEALNIAFVLGIADKEYVFDEKIAEFNGIATRPNTHYAAISIESSPKLISEVTIPDLTTRGYTSVMMERLQSGIQADLASKIASYTPSSPGNDVAGALSLAVRALNANMADGRRNVLVIYASGISTDGIINMIETPVYKMDVEASSEAAVKKLNLNMENIEVICYCIGDSANQEPLSENERNILKSFYRSVLESMGAASIVFKEDLPSTQFYSFPETPVPSMAVEETASALQEMTVLKPEIFEEDQPAPSAPVVIPEEQIRFKSDSSAFVDPSSAEEVLRPIAEYMIANGGFRILLYGTCAGDRASDLGRKRAERVKETIVSFGVDENRIVAITIDPQYDPYYQFGLGTGTDAKVNRKVVVLNMDSELAEELYLHAL